MLLEQTQDLCRGVPGPHSQVILVLSDLAVNGPGQVLVAEPLLRIDYSRICFRKNVVTRCGLMTPITFR